VLLRRFAQAAGVDFDRGMQRAIGTRDSMSEAGIERLAMGGTAVRAEQLIFHGRIVRGHDATWVALPAILQMTNVKINLDF